MNRGGTLFFHRCSETPEQRWNHPGQPELWLQTLGQVCSRVTPGQAILLWGFISRKWNLRMCIKGCELGAEGHRERPGPIRVAGLSRPRWLSGSGFPGTA